MRAKARISSVGYHLQDIIRRKPYIISHHSQFCEETGSEGLLGSRKATTATQSGFRAERRSNGAGGYLPSGKWSKAQFATTK